MSTRISVDTVATSRFHRPAQTCDAVKRIQAEQHMITSVLAKSQCVSAEQFLAAAITEVRSLELAHGQMTFCSDSIVKAVCNCATLGLLFGATRGHVWLVPVEKRAADKVQVNLIVGYKGYIELAYRSNFLKSVDTEVVLEGENFRARMTEHGRKLRHDLPIGRQPERDGSNVVGAYCLYHTTRGAFGISIVTKSEIDAARKETESWKSFYPAMARKTAILRASKNWSLTEQLSAAVHLDGAVERNVEQPALFAQQRPADKSASHFDVSMPPSFTLEEISDADGDVAEYFDSLVGVPSSAWLTKLLDSQCIGVISFDQMTHIVDHRLSSPDPRSQIIQCLWTATSAGQLNELLADVESLRQRGAITAELYASLKRFASRKGKDLS